MGYDRFLHFCPSTTDQVANRKVLTQEKLRCTHTSSTMRTRAKVNVDHALSFNARMK